MRFFKAFITSALILTMILSVAFPAQAASKVTVADSSVKLYKSCSTNCDDYVTLKKGAKVTVYDTNGDWAKVKYNGKKGFILKSGLNAPSSSASVQSKSASSPASDSVSAWAASTLKVYKKASTSGGSYGKISKGTKVTVYDTNDNWAKVKVNGKNGFVKLSGLSKSQTSSSGGSSSSIKQMDWFDSNISSLFYKGRTVKVTDVNTGISWNETRIGGTNHADVTPATSADTAKLKKVYGGAWSWNRRAIYVTINGVRYAASMNGMPHGGANGVSNGYGGHHCIHFTNSKTHGSNKIDSAHQAMIKKAAK